MGTGDSAAHTYLYRKVVIDKEIVSRFAWSQGLLELEAFYKEAQTTPTPVHATYLVSGVVSPTPAAVSNDSPGLEDTSPQASTSQVRAQDLDPALLATTSELVRQKDNDSPGPEYAKAIGMILNPHWTTAAMAPPPPTKTPVAPPTAPLKSESSKDPKSSDGPSGVPKVAEKLKAGTLDWGKAKVKGAEASSSKLSRATSDSKLAENGASNSKRGIKREVPESDTEEDLKSDKPATRVDPRSKSSTTTKSNPLPRSASTTSTKTLLHPVQISKRSVSPAPSVRVKRRILLSDDEEEDDEVVQSSKPAKRAKPAIESNPTKKLGTKALIDDLSEEDAEVDTKPLKTVHRTSGKRSRDILDSDAEDENEGVSPEEPLSDTSEDAPEHVPLSKNEARRKLKDPRVKAAPKVKEEVLGVDAAVKREKDAAKKALKKEVKKGKLKTRTYTNARGMLVTEDYFSPDAASDVDGDKPTDPSTKEDAAEPKKESSKPKPKPRPRTSTKAKEDVPSKAPDENDAAAPETRTKKLAGEESSALTSTRVASDHKNDKVDTTASTKKVAATSSDKDKVAGSKTSKTTKNSKGDAPAAPATATGKKLAASSSEKGKPAASSTTKATKAKTAGQQTLAGFFKQ
ncbi:hypothetical protein BS47DRAFT_1348914 [Hydnum rufescens UP504]|uniref:DNA polymerase delta subunit 3 n=1 Tax=Hydnum rufescens UP504 TaxID=1448309 RepID=A0A9P6DTH7_9AGAM|nr:hypothetical protein BS47DRAFT_1348914 [Hydnum rufescens UP504]